MTFAEYMTALAVGLSALNAVVLLLTFHRAGRWRESEDAKAMLARLTKVESDINGFKTRFENVATKADMARLTAEVNGMEQLFKAKVDGLGELVKTTDAGVVRIEQLLMRGMK
ncbi:hypothetical protein [Brevundimonas vesicularis]|uniref:DUF2730 domain-containing protein n=1 Tax=Brevundimonas vesicularis TaxID=41276 RepID=A0A1Z3U7V7_BREVE|nr:hypothetical protein [Brevundimonas vesicularis]ASE39359.1 hypothetical protein CEP68_07500 [Brevundimonas vesicularis]